jgi:uncharacterized membrane protein YqjE
MNNYESGGSTNGGSSGPGVMDTVRTTRDEARAVGSEARDIFSEIGTLAAKESELAKAEIREGVSAYGRGAAFGAGAAIFAWMTLLFLALGLMFVLNEFMDLWVAALATAAVLLVVTAVLGLMARSAFSSGSLVPQKAIKSVQEDVRWAKAQMKSTAR